jgi:hypothetical protein
MKIKDRFRWGFKFGRIEHKTRAIAYWLLFIGFTILAIICFYSHNIYFTIATIMIGCSLVVETLSYLAHKLEKRMMDKIRFNKHHR